MSLSRIQNIAMRVLETFDRDAHGCAVNVNPAPRSWSQEEPEIRKRQSLLVLMSRELMKSNPDAHRQILCLSIIIKSHDNIL